MNKTILITGGSGEIGAAIAKHAAAEGFNICLNYFSNENAAKQISEEISKTGANIIYVKANIAEPVEVSKMFDECEKRLGPLTHLVNCAGIVGGVNLLENLPIETLRQVIEVNIIGTFICCKEAIRRFKQNVTYKDFGIVNVSSQAATHGSPNEWIHYASSKGAINTLTTGLSKEIGKYNIRVNAVSPGIINTQIHYKAGKPERLITALKEIPLERIGTVEEVADVVLFLLSERASYISGANISIGGGR